MGRKWVVNASPCILLAKVGQADLLNALAKSLVIPQAVLDEIKAARMDDPARLWLAANSAVVSAQSVLVPVAIASWDLGPGENSLLAWAYRNPGCEAIVDDRMDRRCAEALGVPVRGTMGVVLLAKQEGLLTQVSLVIDALIAAGLRVSDALVAKSLQLAGEA